MAYEDHAAFINIATTVADSIYSWSFCGIGTALAITNSMDAFIAASIAVNGVVFCVIAGLDEKTFSCCGDCGQQNALFLALSLVRAATH